MRQYRIPIFIPHEGCPHECIFCNQRKITGVESSLDPSALQNTIRQSLDRLPRGEKQVEIAFFGGSFTGLPIALQERFYRAAEPFLDEVDGLRLSTRPDYINHEVLTLAKKWCVKTIELGAQSASDTVLEKNCRFHTFAQTVSAVSMIRKAGIGVGLQMMSGMYASSPECDRMTAQKFLALGPDCVRIYPTLVLQDTMLANLYQKGLYHPQTLAEAVDTVKDMVLLFRRENIPVIRIGLHSGEDIQKPGVILAGPFHPAFGEMVESRIWRDRMEKMLPRTENRSVWCVTVPKGAVSKAIGHKRCNAEYFWKKYHIKLSVKEEKEESIVN